MYNPRHWGFPASLGTSHCYRQIESPLGFSLVQYFNQARSLTSSCEDYHNDQVPWAPPMATKDLPSLENGIQTGDVTWTEWQGQGQCSWGPTDTWLCAVSAPPLCSKTCGPGRGQGHTVLWPYPPYSVLGSPTSEQCLPLIQLAIQSLTEEISSPYWHKCHQRHVNMWPAFIS